MLGMSEGDPIHRDAMLRGPAQRRGDRPFLVRIARTFGNFTRQYGLNRHIRPLSGAHFRRSESGGRPRLF